MRLRVLSNYMKGVRAAYPRWAAWLQSLGVDIEKPLEAMPLEPEPNGMIEYCGVQYVILGDQEDFSCPPDPGMHAEITDSHPWTQLSEPHFVIEIGPIRLKWAMDTEEGT